MFKALFSGKTKGHFSQHGEDIIIHKLFPRNYKNGTYVDIGAFHPFYFSNTAYLWLKGWSGINVDANPHSIKLFENVRPSDTNIFGAVVSCEIAKNQKTMPIFASGNGINPMGTCDVKTADSRGYLKAMQAPTITVTNIFERLSDRKIDFLNIDIEGLDEVILNEIDFQTYLPKVICIEDYSEDISAALASRITTKLVSSGYSMQFRLGPSSIFQLRAKE